jgi:hypothetical protein
MAVFIRPDGFGPLPNQTHLVLEGGLKLLLQIIYFEGVSCREKLVSHCDYTGDRHV